MNFNGLIGFFFKNVIARKYNFYTDVALGLHKHREKAHILSSQSTVSAVKKKTEPTDVLKRLPTNLIPAVIQSSNEAIALSKSLKEADTQGKAVVLCTMSRFKAAKLLFLMIYVLTRAIRR